MKNYYLWTTYLSILATPAAYADVAITAPGMGAVKQVSGTNIQNSIQLGNYWSYSITGCSYRLVAGVPTNGGIDNEGKLVTERGNSYAGYSSLSASAKSSTILNQDQLNASTIYDTKSGGTTISSPITFNNENVIINVTQSTNMVDDSGTFIAIQAVALKQPPLPSGEIQVADLVREGATPNIMWVVRREGSMGVAPSLPSGVTNWSPTVTPGETPPCTEEKPPEEGGGQVTDTPNCGENKTNNGHGNNADGVDVSNPGKSAEKWNDKWGIIDQSGNYDDESKGGGSAVSKNKK